MRITSYELYNWSHLNSQDLGTVVPNLGAAGLDLIGVSSHSS